MRIQAAIKTLVMLCCIALPIIVNAAPGAPISSTNKYAWSEAVGWSNFKPTNGGVTVYDDHLEGKAWSDGIGWIKLGSYSGGGVYAYAITSNADWGVNRIEGTLTGFGWSETAGWINFKPTNGGVTVNAATGVFDGTAWSEAVGWIHFKGTATNADTYIASTSPTITLTPTPISYSNQASGTIEFSANEASTFQCKVDSGSHAACTSPFSYSGLGNGLHTVTIKAQNN